MINVWVKTAVNQKQGSTKQEWQKLNYILVMVRESGSQGVRESGSQGVCIRLKTAGIGFV